MKENTTSEKSDWRNVYNYKNCCRIYLLYFGLSDILICYFIKQQIFLFPDEFAKLTTSAASTGHLD